MSRILNLTMNRGEWSEAYALLTLASSSDFFLVDKFLTNQNTTQYKVSSILLPTDIPNSFVTLTLQNNSVLSSFNGQSNLIPLLEIKNNATQLYNQILTSTTTTFPFNLLDSLWTKFFNPQIKASQSAKTDIRLEITDTASQQKSVSGFSIKSNLGDPTSLLNASQLTNFLYEAHSNIQTTFLKPKKLGKFVISVPIKHHGSITTTYKQNLLAISPHLEDLISYLLIEYFGASNREKYIKDLIPLVVNKNPLNFSNLGLYKQIISQFLTITAFGMVPRSIWNGTLSANGGMIVVKNNGDLGNFYLNDSQSKSNLSDYLYEHTFLDTASTSRHDFGKVFDNKFFKFNLLIRL